ncbi:MAG TPA: hypothetical protein VGT41_00680 [Candidatus Babeliales bacterium]|nr:hypothetical protein [Candidatus Babeliales bacterium]
MKRSMTRIVGLFLAMIMVPNPFYAAEEPGEEEVKEQRGVFEEEQREAGLRAEQTERDARIAQELAAQEREEMEQAAIARIRAMQAEDKKELDELLRRQSTKPVSQDTVQELSRLSRRGGQAQRTALGHGSMRQMIGAFDSVWSDRRLMRDVGNTVASLAVSVDGRYLVVGTSDGAIEIWDTHVWGQPMKVIDSAQQESIDYITFSADGRYCACGSRLGKITVFTVTDWKMVLIVLNRDVVIGRSQGDFLSALTFTADSRYLLSGLSNRTIDLF